MERERGDTTPEGETRGQVHYDVGNDPVTAPESSVEVTGDDRDAAPTEHAAGSTQESSEAESSSQPT